MQLNDDDRRVFLQKDWPKYPQMPENGCLYSGRLLQLDRSKGTLTILNDDIFEDKVNPIELSYDKMQLECSRVPLDKVLRAGDIVCIFADDRVRLLNATSLDSQVNHSQQFTNENHPSIVDFGGITQEFRRKKLWNDYIAMVREFFNEKKFHEALTPILVPCPGTEPNLDLFSCEYKLGSSKERLFLRTSPEYGLKKLLIKGARKIFEIAPCFRNNELTPLHRPEFMMLEWYRAYDNLESIKKDAIELIFNLAKLVDSTPPKSIVQLSLADIFAQLFDFEFRPNTSFLELKNLASSLNLDVASAESIDDLFCIILAEKIEPRFDPESLTIVCNFPPFQAALSRINENGWADRFEIYWKGMELANAFHELNDPVEQFQRIQADLDKKKQMGKEIPSLDYEFLGLMNLGMPPSGGIALGLNRLFMALHNVAIY